VEASEEEVRVASFDREMVAVDAVDGEGLVERLVGEEGLVC
jgi:hypothetical protein